MTNSQPHGPPLERFKLVPIAKIWKQKQKQTKENRFKHLNTKIESVKFVLNKYTKSATLLKHRIDYFLFTLIFPFKINSKHNSKYGMSFTFEYWIVWKVHFVISLALYSSFMCCVRLLQCENSNAVSHWNHSNRHQYTNEEDRSMFIQVLIVFVCLFGKSH